MILSLAVRPCQCEAQKLLGGSWDFLSLDMGALVGALSNDKYSFPKHNPRYKSHDPRSSIFQRWRCWASFHTYIILAVKR